MLNEDQLLEIRLDVAAAHYFGLRSATEGRTFMSLLATRKQVVAARKETSVSNQSNTYEAKQTEAKRLSEILESSQDFYPESSMRFNSALAESCEQAAAELRRLDAENHELRDALHAFLRAPSVGSNGPGSITIVVQDFNMKAARALFAAAPCAKPEHEFIQSKSQSVRSAHRP